MSSFNNYQNINNKNINSSSDVTNTMTSLTGGGAAPDAKSVRFTDPESKQDIYDCLIRILGWWIIFFRLLIKICPPPPVFRDAAPQKLDMRYIYIYIYA